MSEYAYPEVLVDTQWVAEHRDDPQVRLVEVDVDTSAYYEGHIPGSIAWNWVTQLNDSVRRDIVGKEQFENLMADSGITPDTTIVLYGDRCNWSATWALWQLKLYGHADVRLMNGGYGKWRSEGRALNREIPSIQRQQYVAQDPDFSDRVFFRDVKQIVEGDLEGQLVDVRGPREYHGEILAPPGVPETSQRAGRIPGAINVPWEHTCNPDGTFKSHDELTELYASAGLKPGMPTITYSRIGKGGSHAWFVLKFLAGYDRVRNYDGAWTEWGNAVGAPIETSEGVTSPTPAIYQRLYKVVMSDVAAG
ncbi:MAG: sulfurtransferase [Thioalkalivibrio sp.]|jgi:thiosulfate/3-mercaptopyruvate sulfurtransferase|nr:sulfurtransferase [Thioalkalivibrio sp.]